MTAAADARAHLRKAQEFLEAAGYERDLGLFNPAASAAVTAGINAKDAICLALTGRTDKSDDHGRAVAELKASGPAGAELASTLSRLLRLKTKAQYQPRSVAASDAVKAVEWAARIVEGAHEVVNST